MSDATEERDNRIAGNVTDHGWHAMGVGAEGEAPADWAYSIGLWHTLRRTRPSGRGLSSTSL
ncbi:DUF4262 domain-containing protein [Mycobacterium sp. TNTM28]|uniref:DUF4262 domain-containing protein n=1 Tax=[Mycobacterium] fortunisiensis TaxID=2600579 RepID=A0ABS6KRL1_9MYCO|nr:DUF4262 domain-containing protein [[Mycobacterium] fortunisiensis]MBU9766202.1 DUF4262 domain-containing protein [[Mycobacterium] fortunisiensis]